MRARAIIRNAASDVASGRGWKLRARFALALVAVALVAFAPPSAARAQEVLRSFHAVYEIQPDGTVRVTETITWDFGAERDRHGILRDLIVRATCGGTREGLADGETPLFPCEKGTARRWPVSAVSVEAAGEGEDFRREPFTSTRVGDALQLKIGSADVTVSGVRVYRIRYVLERSLDAYPGHDEFYWNVTGVSTVATLEASAEVRLPDGAEELRGRCLEGTGASTSECETEVSGATLRYRATGPLSPGEQLTIVAGWPKGLVVVPEPLYEDILSVDDFFTLDAVEIGGTGLAGILGFAGVAGLWWRHGRDRRYRSIYYLTRDATEERKPLFGGRQEVVVEFVPPEDLKPAQMGVILDERADPLD